MPVIVEGEVPERRKRNRRGWLVLLVLPAMFLVTLVYATFRPVELQLGPLVVVILADEVGSSGWGVGSRALTVTNSKLHVKGHWYTITKPGRSVYVRADRWVYGMGWFQGHRQ